VGLVLLEAPAAPVATLEEAQVQTRSENAQESALLAGQVATATAMAEAFCRRRFVRQRWRVTLDAFPGGCAAGPRGIGGLSWSGMPSWYDTVALSVARLRRAIVVPYPPLLSVENVTYVDGAGAVQTLDPAAYLVRAAETPGEIALAYGTNWPATRASYDAVAVEFTCGFGDAAAVPAPIKSAVLMIVATLYDQRGNVAPVQMHEVPQAAQWLLGPYRVTRFA
jgi:uncharacterized phiE125 gp8 family phage protein